MSRAGNKKKTTKKTEIFEELLVTTDGGRSERLSNVAVLCERSEEREGRGTCWSESSFGECRIDPHQIDQRRDILTDVFCIT